MVELREETGVQWSLTERLVRSRLQWVGHVERIERYARKAGEEEDWKKKTRDGGGWKRLADEAVNKLRAARSEWE